jgi:hypothetical protein
MFTVDETITPVYPEVQLHSDRAGHRPMHPDDFEAHLAWITAKRFQEQVIEKTCAEQPVYYRIIGRPL